MASTDLGDLGPSESEPAVVPWHWYYHLLGFAGWAFLGALLVLVKENRNRSASLILIPFLLLSEVIWPSTVRLLSLSSSIERQYALPLNSMLVAWTAIWLLSPWLARRRPATAFLLTLGVGLIVGISAEIGVLPPLPEARMYRAYVYRFLEQGIYVFALPVAFALSAMCCRKRCRPRRFMILLAPWLVVAVLAGLTCEFIYVSTLPANRTSEQPLLFLLPRLAIASLGYAAILYLLNLPFMYLAFHCAEYRDRFHKVLRLPEYQPDRADRGQ